MSSGGDAPAGERRARHSTPLAGIGLVFGAAAGGIVGVLLGGLLLGAGIGCVAGLLVGAAAEAHRSQRRRG